MLPNVFSTVPRTADPADPADAAEADPADPADPADLADPFDGSGSRPRSTSFGVLGFKFDGMFSSARQENSADPETNADKTPPARPLVDRSVETPILAGKPAPFTARLSRSSSSMRFVSWNGRLESLPESSRSLDPETSLDARTSDEHPVEASTRACPSPRAGRRSATHEANGKLPDGSAEPDPNEAHVIYGFDPTLGWATRLALWMAGFLLRLVLFVFVQRSPRNHARRRHESPVVTKVVNAFVSSSWPLIRRAARRGVSTRLKEIINESLRNRPRAEQKIKELANLDLDIGPHPFVVLSSSVEQSYRGRHSFIDVDLQTRIWAESFELTADLNIVGSSPDITAALSSMSLEDQLIRVRLGPLQSRMPCFQALQVAFASKPTLDLTLDVGPHQSYTGAVCSSLFSNVGTFLGKNVIEMAIENFLVWPNKVIVRTSDWAHLISWLPAQPPSPPEGTFKPKRIGHLCVNVVEAKELAVNKTLSSDSDPFVKVRVGTAQRRTPTCNDTINPKWMTRPARAGKTRKQLSSAIHAIQAAKLSSGTTNEPGCEARVSADSSLFSLAWSSLWFSARTPESESEPEPEPEISPGPATPTAPLGAGPPRVNFVGVRDDTPPTEAKADVLARPLGPSTSDEDHSGPPPSTDDAQFMFQFPVVESSQSLEVEVWDDESSGVFFRDVMLGSAEVVIDDLEPDQLYTRWHDLDCSEFFRRFVSKRLTRAPEHRSRVLLQYKWVPLRAMSSTVSSRVMLCAFLSAWVVAHFVLTCARAFVDQVHLRWLASFALWHAGVAGFAAVLAGPCLSGMLRVFEKELLGEETKASASKSVAHVNFATATAKRETAQQTTSVKGGASEAWTEPVDAGDTSTPFLSGLAVEHGGRPESIEPSVRFLETLSAEETLVMEGTCSSDA